MSSESKIDNETAHGDYKNHKKINEGSSEDCHENHHECRCDCDCCIGPQGSQGPMGPQGPAGPQGPMGAQGTIGSQGSMGTQGPIGPQGCKGPKGCKGETGPQGETGETGPQGETGETGPKGETGETGPKGDMGETGPKGDMGETGPKGDMGETGPKGDMGETGPQGDMGETGPKGQDYVPAYIFIYSTNTQVVPLGSPISFENTGPILNFTQIDTFTVECNLSGVYKCLTTVDTLEPNAFAIYVNGVLSSGSWFGANATAQDIGLSIINLLVGDKIKVINQSSQGGSVTLAPLGSGANPTVGQSTAAFSAFRISA